MFVFSLIGTSTLPLRNTAWNENLRRASSEILEQSTSGASTVPMTGPLEIPYVPLDSPREMTDEYEIPISLTHGDFSSLSTEVTSIASCVPIATNTPPTIVVPPLASPDRFSSDDSPSEIGESFHPPPATLLSHDYCASFRRGIAHRSSMPHSSSSGISLFTRKNSLPVSLRQKRDPIPVSSPKSPCSLLMHPTSPMRSIKFTFPKHYQHPGNNQSFLTSDEELSASPPDKPASSGYNSYVSMNAGTEFSPPHHVDFKAVVAGPSGVPNGIVKRLDLSSYSNC